MQFLSPAFVVLFGVCFCWLGSGCGLSSARRQNAVLLAFSAVFIAWQHPLFLGAAVGVAAFAFGWARHLETARGAAPDPATGERRATRRLRGGVGLLVAGWVAMHYAGCFGASWVVPLGLSFYTFQAIGYLVDVYWEEERAERDAVAFGVYMLFFMKFLSGPIERASGLLPQLHVARGFDYDRTVSGARLVLLGLVKKLLIANQLTAQTTAAFAAPDDLSGIQAVVLLLLYPIELYADFSGYTDIAVGGARMLGLELTPNFRRPFAALSTADFWRRWHISLSFWVRDYLYVPLTAALRDRAWGGPVALCTTFVLLGVWHGAGWNYAIYGLLQGVFIYWEMKTGALRRAVYGLTGKRLGDALMIVRTYLLFALSLIFFRLASLADVGTFFSHCSLSVHHSWKEANLGIRDHQLIVAGVAWVLVLLYEWLDERFALGEHWAHGPALVRWTLYFLLAATLLTQGITDTENFIYAQF